ncbi:MAG: NAD(P)H-dependent oxidoreductase [Clostridiales bacterium]|jgi:multimeric flavodoxin WrbA|nr:NAD(P)H-dependent oxidoreductase [Clostridiales bacterium]
MDITAPAASALQLIVPGQASARLEDTLRYALDGLTYIRAAHIKELRPGPVLFAAPIGGSGVNFELYRLIEEMYRAPLSLAGCVGGVIVDGDGELFTKSVSRLLLFSANQQGCVFPGQPLVEATGSLCNFTTRAAVGHSDKLAAYHLAARQLVGRVLAFQRPQKKAPKLLVVHTGNRQTSNTMTLWGMVKAHLPSGMRIKEIALRNGAVADCQGCGFTACRHMGEEGNCFYGGVMVDEVYPALMDADALMLLCPNYNDAVDANMTAFINRLTAIYRTTRFYGRALFGIVVSGYSGGDIVAKQLISALNMNKSFHLPDRFCMLETANDPGSIRHVPGIETRAADYAQRLAAHLLE